MLMKLRGLVNSPAAEGVLLLLAACLAMIAANSSLSPAYSALLSMPLEVRVADLEIAKPLLLWINDGLMAVFFFLVGLELKKELLEGELSDPAKVALPVVAAVGGMAAPALIYVLINAGDASAMRGWAIPSATDIAFALGVLALLGDKVPRSLKLFLLTLAIVDDMGAILIIAFFYTADLSELSLLVAGACLVALFLLNRFKVTRMAAYLLIGLVMWVAVLKSGVHATLAGALLAFFIPLRSADGKVSPLHLMERDLRPVVAFGILPLFAFANTGVPVTQMSPADMTAPIPLGIALGLFFGNQIGIMSTCWLAVKLRLARLPADVDWADLYGVALLCGIGFTMSLFIGSLAFDQGGPQTVDERVGILLGSILSAVCGYAWLRWRLRGKGA